MSRSPQRLIGISNEGQTCYLNSLMVLVAYTPEIKELFLTLPQKVIDDLEEKSKSKILQLQKLIARLMGIYSSYTSAKELTQSFGWTETDLTVQHDVMEINRRLIDQFHTALDKTESQNQLINLYGGLEVNVITCLNCNTRSETRNSFNEILVPIRPTIEEALHEAYNSVETLDGDNKYNCECCDAYHKAEKTLKLKSAPPILTIGIMRYDLYGNKCSKDVQFSHDLDLKDLFLEKDLKRCTSYDLHAVVVHEGDDNRGHYFTLIKDVDDLGHFDTQNFVECKPSTPSPKKNPVKPQSPKDIGKNIEDVNIEDPAEIFVHFLGSNHIPDKQAKLSQLGIHFHKVTKQSWNKTHKRRYGSLSKFFKSNPKFIFDEKNDIVQLAVKKSPSSPDHLCDGDHPRLNGDVSDENQVESEVGWFKFNDKFVSAVSKRSLKNYFQGEQCAYMLVYRRKDLVRCKEAFRNPLYKIPPKLKTYLDQTNQILQEQRRKQEEIANRLNLEVFTPKSCKVENGFLTKMSDEQPLKLAVDQRILLSKLLDLINESLKDLPNGKQRKKLMRLQQENASDLTTDEKISTIYSIQTLPQDILNPLKCLSEEEGKSLQDCSIVDEMKLFAWNGATVNCQEFIGTENEEKVSVQLICQISKQYQRKVTLFYDHSKTLLEVRNSFLKLMSLRDSARLIIERFVKEDEKTFYKQISKDDRRPLKSFTDCETFVGRKSPPSPNSKEKPLPKDSLFTVTIFNNVNSEKENEFKGLCEEFTILQTWTFHQMKDFIIQSLQLRKFSHDDTSNSRRKSYRLSEKNNFGINVPLLENQSVTNLRDKIIELQIGDKLASDEIVLYPRLKRDEFACKELIVRRGDKVSILFDYFLKNFKLEGDDWHMRKVNCYGNVIAKFEESNKSIEDVGLKHGDFISIAQSKLLAKGYVRVHAFLGPSPTMLKDFTWKMFHGMMNGQVEPTSMYSTILLPTSTKNSHDMRPNTHLSNGIAYLNSIDIKRDSKVYEIHDSILEMVPKSLDHSLWQRMYPDLKKSKPDSRIQNADLCARIYEHNSLGRTLNESLQPTSIKRFTNGNTTTNVILYPLEKAANMKTVQAVFYVPCNGKFTQKSYELCFPEHLDIAIHTIVYNYLKKYLYSESDLVIERWSSDQSCWVEVLRKNEFSNTINNTSKNKGKTRRSNVKKSNVKTDFSSWASLKDNDLIGIKFASWKTDL